MLSRGLSEEDVQAMFAPYGRVEDVSILRNAEGFSKGKLLSQDTFLSPSLRLSLSLSLLRF